MTGLWRELRPYLALWPAVLRLARGTWALLRRLTGLCLAGEGWEKLWRALGCAVLASVVGRIVHHSPLVEVPLLAVWLVTAWRAGPAPQPKPEQTEPEPDDDGDDEQEQQPEQPALPAREQLIEALHAVADPHAHLAAAAHHLGADPALVREAAREAGIPTHPVRVRGRGVSTGVKAADLPPLPPAPTETPGDRCFPGQASNNNTQTPIVERPHEGMLIIRDRADAALRLHKVPRP